MFQALKPDGFFFVSINHKLLTEGFKKLLERKSPVNSKKRKKGREKMRTANIRKEHKTIIR